MFMVRVSETDIYTESKVHRDRVAEIRIFRIYAREFGTLDSQCILRAQIESETCHLHFLDSFLRKIVSDLDIPQFQE